MEEEKRAEEPAFKPKGGRPKKETDERKEVWFSIRMTTAAKQAFTEEAEQAGYEKATDYARKKLFAKETDSLHNPKALLLTIGNLNTEIHKVGVNINQIAKYVNYLEKNKRVDDKFMNDYNTHFKKMLDLQSEFLVAIRAYLRSNKKQ